MKKEYIRPEAEIFSFQLEKELMSMSPSVNMGIVPLPGQQSIDLLP